MRNSRNIIWYSFLIIALIIGIYGVINQSVHGHVLTGISKQIPWGMYIAAFTFFIGVSTGSTLISFIIHVFNRDDLKPLEIRATVIGLVTLLGALMFLIMDVGNPIRMLKVPLILRNVTSVFFYSSLSYYAFGAILAYHLWNLIRLKNDPQNDSLKRNIRWVAILAFPFAMGIVLVPDGALFSFVKAREFWNRPLLLPHFANAGLASAMAVIVVISFISNKIEDKPLLNYSARMLIGYLLIFLTAGVLFLDMFDILVLKYSEKPEGIEAWKLLTGKHLLLFLTNILGLFLGILVLLAPKGKSIERMLLSSILIILAISAFRYNLVIVGQEIPLFEGEHLTFYKPTFTEISIAAGITSFAILAYQIIIKRFDTNDLSVTGA